MYNIEQFNLAVSRSDVLHTQAYSTLYEEEVWAIGRSVFRQQ